MIEIRWCQETETRRAIVVVTRADPRSALQVWCRRWVPKLKRWLDHEGLQPVDLIGELATGPEADRARAAAAQQLCMHCSTRVYQRSASRPPMRCDLGACPRCCPVHCDHRSILAAR